MWYSKKEEYVFRMPREHTAYLKFKDELKEAGVQFSEQHAPLQITILIHTSGVFNKE
jgi:hypothetical protein